METSSILTQVEQNYICYGIYINRHRAIPGLDGMKPVYRRTILAAIETGRKLVKSTVIIGQCLKKWHPHGDSSIVPVISNLVHFNIFKGQGNHGCQLIEHLAPAAPRYTEAMYNRELDPILMDLIEYAPSYENELGVDEPDYLITPIPLCLVFGTEGIGLGTNTRIPAFTYKSLLKAFQKNNPRLLDNYYGYKIISMDYDELWNRGEGFIEMTYKVYTQPIDNSVEFVIEGHGALFRPNLNKLIELSNQDRVYIRNESKTHVKIVIGRTKGTSVINDNDLFGMCKKAARVKKKYSIKMLLDNKVRQIGIYTWVKKTMDLFTETWVLHNENLVKKIENKIDLLNNVTNVYELLKEDKSDTTIANTIDREVSFVKEIVSMPLKILRKKDFDTEIKALVDRIKKIDKLKIDKVYKSAASIL